MKWFRVYSEIKDDPKMLELDDHQFRLWMSLLAMANESGERGVIAGVRPRGLAAALRTDESRLSDALNLFDELEMVIYDDTQRTITILNWTERQYDKPSDAPERVAERVRRHRETKRNAPVTPSNATYTDTDTDTELSENSRSPLAAAPRKTRPPTPVPKPIEQDRQNPIWDALAAETGKPATKNERSDFGETVSQLRDAEATPDEIHAFPNWWYESFPGAKLTHRCYREHLGKFRSSPPRPMLPSDIKNPMVRAALTTDMSDITAELEAKHGSRNGLSIENRNPRELFAEPRRIAAGEPRAAPHVLPAPRQPERS